MKKVLIFFLCLPIIGFAQSVFKLGNYIKLTKNNIEFQINKPELPFEESNESFSSGGNANLAISFLSFKPMAALQIYSTPVPLEMQQKIDDFFNSEEAIKSFINQLFPSPVNKILEYRIILVNGKRFLELQLIGAKVQKQINWITFYKNNMINILGATLIEDFEENKSFFISFRNSIIIN